MRISITRKHPSPNPVYKGKPFVVVEVPHAKVVHVYPILRSKINDGKPIFQTQGSKNTRYFLPIKRLRTVVDVLASAELSPAVARWCARRDSKQFSDVLPIKAVPGLAGKLYPFQLRGATIAASRPAFFLHDDMGLGKTVQALSAIALRAAYPALVVCPNSVKAVWGDQVAQWFPGLECIVVDGPRAEREQQLALAPTVHVIVVNYEALRLHPELSRTRWEAIIVDEHHRIKNVDAKQTRALLRIKAKYKLLLSGTPILNGRLEELWPPLHYAFPKDFPGDLDVLQPDWLFRKQYCIMRRGQIVAYQNIADLRTRLHERSLRRRKEEVLTQLPPKVYSVRRVQLTKEQRKLYDDIRSEMLLWMEDGSKKKIRDIRAQVIRLKQACFSPELYGGTQTSSKLEELKLIVKEITEAGHKVIIFSQWARACRIIERELADYPYCYVDGSVSTKERKRRIKDFQDPDGDKQLYIGTIGANKEGITLTAASYVVFTDMDWVPANNEQAADRAHRIGQKDTVNVIEIQAEDTIEESIAAILREKELMNAFMTERELTQPRQTNLLKSLAAIL